jgi:deoxyribodipyrimidine photo-lyase
MRELWETGWMHNRVRMIVGSFLVKDLMITWQEGAAWFKDTLIDMDEANNSMGWQWVAGSGVDASPYFRIFNPMTQSEKFDKNADYIRKWIPELAKLDNKWIHRPFDAPELILKSANIELGKDYPKPLVNHDMARKEALEAFKALKN